jgi:hypothetical protein
MQIRNSGLAITARLLDSLPDLCDDRMIHFSIEQDLAGVC